LIGQLLESDASFALSATLIFTSLVAKFAIQFSVLLLSPR